MLLRLLNEASLLMVIGRMNIGSLRRALLKDTKFATSLSHRLRKNESNWRGYKVCPVHLPLEWLQTIARCFFIAFILLIKRSIWQLVFLAWDRVPAFYAWMIFYEVLIILSNSNDDIAYGRRVYNIGVQNPFYGCLLWAPRAQDEQLIRG